MIQFFVISAPDIHENYKDAGIIHIFIIFKKWLKASPITVKSELAFLSFTIQFMLGWPNEKVRQMQLKDFEDLNCTC